MRKAAILSIVLVLALATTALAWDPTVKGPRLNYMGYCSQLSDGSVNVDTLICVFNPNSAAIPVDISLFNKDGSVIVEGAMLHDGTGPISSIPPMGMGWTTIGKLKAATGTPGLEPLKYPFVIRWTLVAGASFRGLVAEIKEILYTDYVPLEDNRFEPPLSACWNPSVIKSWSETALNKGWGKYGGGVGFTK